MPPIHCRCRNCRRRSWPPRDQVSDRARSPTRPISASRLLTPEIADITRQAAEKFAEAGVIVEEAHPDLREAHECFQTLRAFDFRDQQGKTAARSSRPC